MPINTNPIKPEMPLSEISKKGKKEATFMISEPKYSFDDIILPEQVMEQVRDAIAIYTNQKQIFQDWGLGAVYKRQGNLSANLYGESGTGKTMCAHAIANELNKKLVLVNYAEIESKYVGETSKNLESLFEYAKKNGAIIFFDEADALLSRRVTSMSSATDVSVNQTRNVLLKLLDEHEGIVIFTTNFISNYDPAFLRRIMNHIKFDLPDKLQRYKIWDHYLVSELPLSEEKGVLLEHLSNIEEVSGADISTAVLKAAIHASMLQKESIQEKDFEEEIKRIISVKKAVGNDKFEISTRKVSEEYVKEKLGKEVVENGKNS